MTAIEGEHVARSVLNGIPRQVNVSISRVQDFNPFTAGPRGVVVRRPRIWHRFRDDDVTGDECIAATGRVHLTWCRVVG